MDERKIWDDLVGDAWVRFADILDAHSEPFGLAAIDALEARGGLDGASVIDVGCGTGATTRELADRVGPTGSAVGIDLSLPMITQARSLVSDRTQLSFAAGDVLELAPEAPVNAIHSRFGVMFFDDPVEAFVRLRSFTGRDGRVAFAAWSDPFSNPWMLLPVMASIPLLGPPDLPGPGEPGPFSLGTADVIESTLTGAGWTGIEIDELTLERPFPAGGATGLATMVCETNPVLAAALQRLPERRAETETLIIEALLPYEVDGEVVLRAAASIVSASA